ncbi:MAG: ABC transporter ATP-binding protein [Clostridiales bacterium]|jgi:putative ABC transport system ATP-binding protein|nr:ABC transporter ATP-binding protein [Eubacteriales bacterium]MDH7567279.1 ABC transporter ATP-binding protein [Clostridiales bacterium]
MIDIRNMTKVYEMGNNKLYALRDVSLYIEAKEFVAIVGPSGSGKSTLMNMLGCLDTPTSGEYILDNKNVSHCSDDELAEIRNSKIGFVFQKYNLLPKLNVFENVELPLIYMGTGTGERKARVLEALKKVGLEDRISHKPSELSGGQQQRVSIARALVTNPSVILADEPTGALDSKTGIEVLKTFQQLHTLGKTIILITHDMNIAQQAKRIIRIQDGEIISDELNEVNEEMSSAS